MLKGGKDAGQEVSQCSLPLCVMGRVSGRNVYRFQLEDRYHMRVSIFQQNGTPNQVAVKVMYPQVERLFRTDIQTIKNFCKLGACVCGVLAWWWGCCFDAVRSFIRPPHMTFNSWQHCRST